MDNKLLEVCRNVLREIKEIREFNGGQDIATEIDNRLSINEVYLEVEIKKAVQNETLLS